MITPLDIENKKFARPCSHPTGNILSENRTGSGSGAHSRNGWVRNLRRGNRPLPASLTKWGCFARRGGPGHTAAGEHFSVHREGT